MTISIAAAMWHRDLLRLVRNRSAMISSLMIPSIFLLAFYAAFARSAEHFTDSYASFLLPTGVLQAVIFTAGGSCLPVAQDKEDGFYQRILSMPVPTWTIVAGRLAVDITRMLWSGTVVAVVGILIGARFEGGIGATLLFILAIALITVVFSAAADGFSLITQKPVSTALTFQGMTVLLVMFSTAFVPAEALPRAVRPIIQHIPISPILDTLRNLISGEPLGGTGVEALVWLILLSALGVWGFSAALRRNND